MGRKQDDFALRTKLTEVAFAQQEVKDVETADVEDQGEADVKEERNARVKDSHQAESLDIMASVEEREAAERVTDEEEATEPGKDVSEVISVGPGLVGVLSQESTPDSMVEVEMEPRDDSDDATVEPVGEHDVLAGDKIVETDQAGRDGDQPETWDASLEVSIEEEGADLTAGVDVSTIVDEEEPIEEHVIAKGNTTEDQTEMVVCPEATQATEVMLDGSDYIEAAVKNETECALEDEVEAKDEETQEARSKSEVNENNNGDVLMATAEKAETDAYKEEFNEIPLGDADELSIRGGYDENNNNNESKRRLIRMDKIRQRTAKTGDVHLPKRTDDQEESVPVKGIFSITVNGLKNDSVKQLHFNRLFNIHLNYSSVIYFLGYLL